MVLSEPLKLVLLKNLVEGVPDLENLKTQDQIRTSAGTRAMDFATLSGLVEQIAATMDRRVTGSRALTTRPALQGNAHDLRVHMQEMQTLTDHRHGEVCLHDQFLMEINQHDFRGSDNIDSNIANVSSSVSTFQHEAYQSAYETYAADQRR